MPLMYIVLIPKPTSYKVLIPKELDITYCIHPTGNTSSTVFIPKFLWAEHHFIVTASGTRVHMIGVVLRVGVGIGTSVCELFSSRRGNLSWAINVATTVANCTG
jgi:hypothetical protein